MNYLIIGCSGSGKSTLTRKIAASLSLKPIHLDIHFWKPGWVQTPIENWREQVVELCSGKDWVMDGNFSSTFDLRFPKADKIIVLNPPRILCLWRAIMRVFKYNRTIRRPDMASGCDEKIDFSFYKFIWTFNKKETPKIREAIEKFKCQRKVIFLSSNKEIENFLKTIKL